ncbi:hypothetical protein EYC84_003616 [Monilinia fructicola]|uniref:Uncharacterized protein n=1 Tax=Monilinia fructicola TaxID=38448 RepID=A0A5M9JWR3_MONFR|nr:hypothetical protein EYC84_003616 [Monilinia fructicola]
MDGEIAYENQGVDPPQDDGMGGMEERAHTPTHSTRHSASASADFQTPSQYPPEYPASPPQEDPTKTVDILPLLQPSLRLSRAQLRVYQEMATMAMPTKNKIPGAQVRVRINSNNEARRIALLSKSAW